MPDTPVTERMCLERHKNTEEKLLKFEEGVQDELMKIRILLSGNGDLGLVAKVNTMWEDYQAKKRTSQGWIDWGFRILILLLLSWLGMK